METIQILLLILIALLGIPAGLLISRHTKEELKPGKKWFAVLMIIAGIIVLVSALSDFAEKMLVMTVSGFVFLLALTSLRKTG